MSRHRPVTSSQLANAVARLQFAADERRRYRRGSAEYELATAAEVRLAEEFSELALLRRERYRAN
jgi:hypothetical protein